MPSLFLLSERWSICCSSPHFRGTEVVMSSVKHATIEDLLRANKVLSRAKSESAILTFKNMGHLSTAKFVCFNDSTFGNLCDGGSQGSYVIFLEVQNGNCSPLMWQSKKLCRVVMSTMAAETVTG